jgi:hypothetical protein
MGWALTSWLLWLAAVILRGILRSLSRNRRFSPPPQRHGPATVHSAGSTTNASAKTQPREPRRWVVRRNLRRVGGFLVLAAGAGVGGLMLFPSAQLPHIVPGYWVQVTGGGRVIGLDIDEFHRGSSVELKLAASVTHSPPARSVEFSVDAVDLRDVMAGCGPKASVIDYEIGDPTALSRVRVRTQFATKGGSDLRVGVATLTLHGPGLGWVASDGRIAAQLPAVRGLGKGATMNITYHVPDAANYDWSGNVPIPLTPGALWTSVAKSATTVSTASAIDESVVRSDNTNTFIAGALVGVAGSAVIAAAQALIAESGDPVQEPRT